MIKNFNILLLTIAVFSFVAFFSACSDNAENQSGKDLNWKQTKEKLEEANKNLVKEERGKIDDYIKNNANEFVETGTGLRYCIVNQGDSVLIKTGDIVTMEYETSLLNGELIYSSENDGLKVFQVGRGGVESGLEEAVLHLHRGDEAEIIIPAYLAHGLIGDGNKVPPRSIIVYKLKIIDNQIN